MPPIIALLVCTAFVLFLLRLERKQSQDVSLTIWVPTLWILLIGTKPLAIWFGYYAADMESGSPLDRAFLIALLCIGIIILAKRHFAWGSAIKNNIWVFLLIGYSLISTTWSEMPYVSFKRWIRGMPAIIMAFVVLSERYPLQALGSILRKSIYILIPYSLMLIKYYPHLGVDFGHWSGALMWTGVATQKNGLGRLCMVAVLYLLLSLFRRWRGHDIPVVSYQTYVEIFLLLLTLWLFTGPNHTFAYSATSTVALTAGLAVMVAVIWLQKRNIMIGAGAYTIAIIFILVYGAITPFIGGLSIVDVSSAFGRSETLTGRADIWAVLIPYAMKQPILGYGAGGFWTDAMRDISSSNAHNGALDVILNTGFVGLIFFSTFLITSCVRARQEMTRNFDWSVLWMSLLFMAVVHNIAESTITSFSNFIVALLLFLYVGTSAMKTDQDSTFINHSKSNEN